MDHARHNTGFTQTLAGKRDLFCQLSSPSPLAFIGPAKQPRPKSYEDSGAYNIWISKRQYTQQYQPHPDEPVLCSVAKDTMLAEHQNICEENVEPHWKVV